MGIIANATEFFKQKAVNIAQAAGNGIAAASGLSSKQVEAVEAKRVQYLAGQPDMEAEAVQEVIRRNLGAIAVEVHQAYLNVLDSIYRPLDLAYEFDPLNQMLYFDVTKWVTDAQEKNLDKLVNIYQVLSGEKCNIALLYHRTKERCFVTLGVVNTDPECRDASKVGTYYSRLKGALYGNFPGVEVRETKDAKDSFGVGIPPCLQSAIHDEKADAMIKSVAVVSNLASEKSEDFISQSMEKLLDGIVPADRSEEYTIVLLAKPAQNQLGLKNRLFELYSTLAPYASWQRNFTLTESDMTGASASAGVNLGRSLGKNHSVTVTVPTDYGSISETKGESSSVNFGANFSRGSSVIAQLGKTEGLTQTHTNFGVQYTLDQIKRQLEHVEESTALGMWEFAAYVISESPIIANNVAHMYLALTQGDKSCSTQATVNLWDGEARQEEARAVLKTIQRFQHPVFGLDDRSSDEWLHYPTLVTPTVSLSGKELARALNFPRRAISGLPVFQCVPFGRNVMYLNEENARDNVRLGCIYHMKRKEEVPVNLDRDALTAHTFITGSTGAGKSNVVYTLLNNLCRPADADGNTTFLVIEPAKGEYKDVFGGYKSVSVYGTNGKKAPLLRLNPFSFPDDIHVLEHIDRLVEVFNACWPMYAAMPAVLKDAIEEAYIARGWSLSHSICARGRVYPTFGDVLRLLPQIMKRSEYSKDTQGDYTGALVTRVKSLTNGINGQIFCSGEELKDEDLFGKNVIVDLSRVGSSETKALLMGILMIKLQEHRMANAEGNNAKLRHVTVLEEAHNLLRRTSSEQSQDSANLQGKAVEMLTNAIAEMRTYGEGFIIADQAPGLLDMAVIRNTNTKLILRLPDESDRLLVGKAAGLTEEQIPELARLDVGVAAVFQNHWLEPVLCKVDRFDDSLYRKFTYQPPKEGTVSEANEKLFKSLTDGADHIAALSKENVDSLKNWIERLGLPTFTKQRLLQYMAGETLSKQERKALLYSLAEGKTLLSETEREIIDLKLQEKLMISPTLAAQVRGALCEYVGEVATDNPELQERMRLLRDVRR